MKLNSRLIREARASGLLLPAAIVFGFLAGGLIVLQSFQISRIIARVFLQQQTLAQVIPLLRIVLFIVLARVLFTFLNEYIAGKLAVVIKCRLRHLLFEKLKHLGADYLKNEQTGELVTIALQGVDALDAYFSQYLPQLLIAVMLPLTILVAVFPIDPLSGVVLLLTAPLIPLFMMLIGWASEALTKRQWLAMTRLGSYFLDTLQGIATLKMLGRSKTRASEVRAVSDQYRTATLKVLRVTFLSALVLEMVATISTAVVAVEIGLRLLYSRIEFQQAFFILLVAPEFYIPMRNLSSRYHSAMAGITAARRIYEVLDEPEVERHFETGSPDLDAQFKGDFVISLSNLEYSHAGQADNSLQGINFDFASGKHYALVGMSGSGKSTLAQILLRFIEPNSGTLTINSMDANRWEKTDWRKFIAWVPQHPMIFSRSLLENITLGNPLYSIDEVEKAIHYTELEDFVSALPQGLYTMLSDAGSRISGGEGQRLALARAFLKNPQLLILDEPTAHLDLALEQKIARSTDLLMAGRTTLTIAHRLSTIQTADEILVLDKGRLIDSGSHRDLFARCEVYRGLVSVGRRDR
jgi:ATP-binding cassette subfamily C protein CydD